MKKAIQYHVVLVTAPNLRVARRLARAALQARAAACANIIPRVESHYWWKGKIESASELLILFKTDARRLSQLEKIVLAQHPYETPEFVAVKLAGGSASYLAWLAESLG
jgi:periplasmic divalent cation tolerance protein